MKACQRWLIPIIVVLLMAAACEDGAGQVEIRHRNTFAFPILINWNGSSGDAFAAEQRRVIRSHPDAYEGPIVTIRAFEFIEGKDGPGRLFSPQLGFQGAPGAQVFCLEVPHADFFSGRQVAEIVRNVESGTYPGSGLCP